MVFLSLVRKIRRKEKQMRVLFLGLDNAGKTTILKNINGEDVMSVSPTLGFNIKTLIRDQYTLNIWDVGGQRTLRPYWRNYFESTDAIVWVVDSVDRLRILDCKEELHKLLQEDRLAGASLLVFANKQDIPSCMTAQEIEEELGLRAIKSHNWEIWPCSAHTGDNIEEGLSWILKDVAFRLYYAAVSKAHV